VREERPEDVVDEVRLDQGVGVDPLAVLGRDEDPLDLARGGVATASAAEPGSEAENVINGWVRAIPGSFENRWVAPLAADGAWIELAWESPKKIGSLQLTFDSGFQRELTLSASTEINNGIIRAAQPETVRRYSIRYQEADGGEWVELLSVDGNHQRLRRHKFQQVNAKRIRVHVHETNGDRFARIFEIRCYE